VPARSRIRKASSGLFFVGFGLRRVLNFHVAKLFGVKNFATFQALDEFGVLVAGDDAYFGMSADCGHHVLSQRSSAVCAKL